MWNFKWWKLLNAEHQEKPDKIMVQAKARLVFKSYSPSIWGKEW